MSSNQIAVRAVSIPAPERDHDGEIILRLLIVLLLSGCTSGMSSHHIAVLDLSILAPERDRFIETARLLFPDSCLSPAAHLT